MVSRRVSVRGYAILTNKHIISVHRDDRQTAVAGSLNVATISQRSTQAILLNIIPDRARFEGSLLQYHNLWSPSMQV